MFWKFNLLTSHIDILLDKEDLTLHEILDEDDVLQECKAQNKRLVEFLIRPENVETLVNYITQEPPDDTDEKMRYKYPNTACELLTSDVSQITDKLSGDEVLMGKVYGFLEGEGPLNPLLASFFSKVIGLLITRKSEMMLDFLQSKDDFVGHLLRHLGTSAIMDLLLRLITCIESPECHVRCLNWLSEQQLIAKLVAMIDPSQPEEKHYNASQSLCDIIRLSREQMSQLQEKADPDPLLAVIESQDTIKDLLSHMFDAERLESVLVNGIAVIQTLLEFKRLGFFLFYSSEGGAEPITSLDAERLAHGVNNTVQALTPRLKDFHQTLKEPPKQYFAPMPTTVGCLSPPFGNTRLQTTRLITSLLLTRTEMINTELVRLGTLGVLLDLCFKYMWNNFLHAQVEQCICTVFSGSPEESGEEKSENPLLNQLLTDVNAIEKILEVWEDNDEHQMQPLGHRKGYMGHLTKMANHIVAAVEKGPNSDALQQYFKDLPEKVRERWEIFVSGSLADTNKQNTVELVSTAGGQNLYSSSEDDDPEFHGLSFPQDTAMQQAFSDYQLQQMTSNFIDQLGFNEEDFAEQEERCSEKFKEKISSINFDINTDEISHSATLFEQACNENIQQFEDNESEEDLWEDKEITFSQSSDSRQTSATGAVPSRTLDGPAPTLDSDEEAADTDSTDSEDELDSPQRIHQSPPISASSPDVPPHPDSTSVAENMEVDSSENNWGGFENVSMETAPTNAPVSSSESWPGSSPSESSPQPEGSRTWADFSSIGPSTDAKQASGENNTTWADFTDIADSGNLNSTDPGPRSASPVAMETNDVACKTNSRTAAYMVSSAPADLASDIGSSEPVKDSKVIEISVAASSNDTSTTDISSSCSPSPAEAASHHTTNVTEPPVSSSQPDSSPVESAPPESTVTDSSSQSEQNMDCHSDEVEVEDEKPAEDGEDLGDNFNFLATTGLMKCSDNSGSSTDPVSHPQGEPHSTANQKLEEIRAQAKEALEQYTTATTPPPSQNGPV